MKTSFTVLLVSLAIFLAPPVWAATFVDEVLAEFDRSLRESLKGAVPEEKTLDQCMDELKKDYPLTFQLDEVSAAGIKKAIWNFDSKKLLIAENLRLLDQEKKPMTPLVTALVSKFKAQSALDPWLYELVFRLTNEAVLPLKKEEAERQRRLLQKALP